MFGGKKIIDFSLLTLRLDRDYNKSKVSLMVWAFLIEVEIVKIISLA